MANYYQPEIETMPYEDLHKLQNERFMKQIRHVWDNVPYYRQKMEEKGVTVDDIQSIDDLPKLPFLTKADLRDAYPYGLMGKPLSECVRIQSTSGTTGKRVEPSTPSTTLTCGKTAAPVPSWPLAAPRRMWSMCPLAMVCLPAVPASMAAPTV